MKTDICAVRKGPPAPFGHFPTKLALKIVFSRGAAPRTGSTSHERREEIAEKKERESRESTEKKKQGAAPVQA